jgi:uncharacterized membrane protein
MWIITFLPEWIFHAMLIAGLVGTVAGFVLGMIPLVKKYVIPIRIISLLVLSLALYLEGGLADNAVWQLRVKEVEAKLAKAEAESQKENIKIVEKTVKKLELVRIPGTEIIKYVDREVVKYDATCPVPAPVVKAHNAAALNKPVEGTK